MNARALELEDDDEPTPADLRMLVREISTFWHMGDNQIITEARGALLRVLLNSGKRLRKRPR
jgi:hypothetical protein